MIKNVQVGDIIEMPEELLLNGEKALKYKWMVTAVYPNFVECIRCDNGSLNSYCRGDLVVCGYEEGQNVY